jgi:hypothetical protein
MILLATTASSLLSFKTSRSLLPRHVAKMGTDLHETNINSPLGVRKRVKRLSVTLLPVGGSVIDAIVDYRFFEETLTLGAFFVHVETQHRDLIQNFVRS